MSGNGGRQSSGVNLRATPVPPKRCRPPIGSMSALGQKRHSAAGNKNNLAALFKVTFWATQSVTFVASSTESARASHKGAPHGGTLIFFSFMISAVLAACSLVVTSGDGSRAAGELVTRFSLLLFVSSLLVVPHAQLLPIPKLRAIARERENLRLAFVTAFAFSLACIIAPVELAGEGLSAAALFYFAFNTMVLIVMIFAGRRAAVRLLGLRACRAMRSIATAYFWLVFVLSDLAQIASGTGGWYMFSLILLSGTILTAVSAHFATPLQVKAAIESPAENPTAD